MTPILNHYFARINWSGAAAVNIDTLRALHLKHNCTIPFENLDVLLPREIQLDNQSLEEKLVIARRGGYCFLENGVFVRGFRGLGVYVCSLFGGVVLLKTPAFPPRPPPFLLGGMGEGKRGGCVGFWGAAANAPRWLFPRL
uniref:arylamine N-acetyltransferase n=1 Tax=Escherichia coli TaxID=562 RepID=UPI00156DF6B4